ncbi:hypothetical protein J6590_000070 [Homalodisca vitripennis]|nr:hypothetical protein J6590_000070 [Homalodisca vitripennis]
MEKVKGLGIGKVNSDKPISIDLNIINNYFVDIPIDLSGVRDYTNELSVALLKRARHQFSFAGSTEPDVMSAILRTSSNAVGADFIILAQVQQDDIETKRHVTYSSTSLDPDKFKFWPQIPDIIVEVEEFTYLGCLIENWTACRRTCCGKNATDNISVISLEDGCFLALLYSIRCSLLKITGASIFHVIAFQRTWVYNQGAHPSEVGTIHEFVVSGMTKAYKTG